VTVRPDIERAFAHLISLAAPEDDSPEALLRAVRAGMERYGDVEPRRPTAGVEVRRVEAAGRPAEWLCPPDLDEGGRILWLHGGGLVAGSPRSHRPIASTVALLSGRPVLVLDYRLAPEHPYPAALDDASGAWAWLTANGPDGAGEARSACLVGDSAGGSLAVAVCARAIEAGRRPDRLALLGPCVDFTLGGGRKDLATDPLVNDDAVAALALYAGDAPLEHPSISSLFTPEAMLARFPPTLIQASGCEYLLPDAQAMAGRLAAVDRRVVLSVWPGLPHLWHHFVALLPEARQALAEVAAFLAD
jgi:acetyl esterase/lipase